jgi:hypothetical protein
MEHADAFLLLFPLVSFMDSMYGNLYLAFRQLSIYLYIDFHVE